MMSRMKYFFLFLLFNIGTLAHAEEGMWLPQLLKQLNEEDMKSLGMEISADEIYNINHSSIKDAIVSFNGGCTGEIISNQGLLLTNHHCGYGQIQSHSSVENDYLTDGFWAMSKEKELPNEDLYVTFIVKIEDITDKITKGLLKLEGKTLQDSIQNRIPKLKQEATDGTHFEAVIKPFFYGNKYYMFLTETYTDIRLVGAPPSSIGKFGGDTDNWVWPRHTGDFSIFRIYASPDGKPAKYAEENVPLIPKHYLPINISGIKEGDFSMVFGFPGRTQEYLTSYAVSSLVNKINPARIKIRQEKLALMKADMDKNDKVRIQYASKYARVANYYKKWIGENRGLKISEAIKTKENQETEFQQWADKQENIEYKELLTKMKDANEKIAPYELPYQYMREAFFGVELMSLVVRTNRIRSKNDEEKLKKTLSKFYKDYNPATDKEMFSAMMKILDRKVSEQFLPDLFIKYKKQYKGNFDKMAKDLFKKTKLTKESNGTELFSHKKKLAKDPIVQLANAFYEIYYEQLIPELRAKDSELQLLRKVYIKGLMEMSPNKNFYPDANSTMRVSYGLIDGNEPEDGMRYTFQTTLEGIIRKNESGSPDFEIPEKLRKLYDTKNYGDYAENGKMPVCFLASNHTTGGNSGSPIIDANGNLIGLNFDRTWQSTMSDVMYNAKICRNIGVDVRYILFIIDKYAGATHLVKEMNLIKKSAEVPSNAVEKAEEEEKL